MGVLSIRYYCKRYNEFHFSRWVFMREIHSVITKCFVLWVGRAFFNFLQPRWGRSPVECRIWHIYIPF